MSKQLQGYIKNQRKVLMAVKAMSRMAKNNPWLVQVLDGHRRSILANISVTAAQLTTNEELFAKAYERHMELWLVRPSMNHDQELGDEYWGH